MEKQIMSKKAFNRICTVQIFLSFFLALMALFCFVTPIDIPSPSMEPTFHAGGRYLSTFTDSDHITYDDVITFFPFIEEDAGHVNIIQFYWRAYIRHEVLYIKRVIGLPGDVIEVKDGYVWRNGEKLDPDYLTVTTDGAFGPYEVPENTVFCMGDNRNNSGDSRVHGAFPANGVVGKVPASWIDHWHSRDP